MKIIHRSILFLFVLFSTSSFAVSLSNNSCTNDAFKTFVAPGAKGYLVNLVFLQNTNVNDVKITYRIVRFNPFSDDPPHWGPWVSRNMQASSPWYYTSNRIDVFTDEKLEYRFAYNVSGSHCISKVYSFYSSN